MNSNNKKKGKNRKFTVVFRILVYSFILIFSFLLVLQFFDDMKVEVIVKFIDRICRAISKRLRYWQNNLNHQVSTQFKSSTEKNILTTNGTINISPTISTTQSPTTGTNSHKISTSTKPILVSKPKAKPKKVKPKKTRKPRGPDDWMYDGVYNVDEEWGYPSPAGGRGFTNSCWYNLTHIKIMPTDKIPIKKDRRVVLTLQNYDNRNSLKAIDSYNSTPTFQVGSPRELLHANRVLQAHPFFHRPPSLNASCLEDVLVFIKEQSQCARSPVFLGMATVGEDLYWQLIENYFYTLVK